MTVWSGIFDYPEWTLTLHSLPTTMRDDAAERPEPGMSGDLT